MYSNLKSVQYLIAGLKTYNISDVVISPGNSHNAIVRSMDEDPFFKTYSIVDERSASFFACGLAQELKRPIAICCTAGTAATNYMTGITEASRRGLPIVVITGDKNQYYLAQYEDQMIDSVSIFKSITRHGCVLPIVETPKDEWYCQRVINETLLELDHHGTGPVHIDVPIEAGMFAIRETFTTVDLPVFHKIDRYDLSKTSKSIENKFLSLKNKKVLLMFGQDDHISRHETELLEEIIRKYNCVFATDKLSNLHCKGTVEVTRATKNLSMQDELWPDVVISLAGNPAMDYKFKFKNEQKRAEHWIVNQEGRVADPFRKLSAVFEGTTTQFLETMAQYEVQEGESQYYKSWLSAFEKVLIPKFEYSNLYAVKSLMERLPKDCNLNIANSTIIRIAQFFDLDDSIQVYCNRGVNGIDGCVSTFVGQAAASPDTMNFLMVGDLTFFYDMNAIWNRYRGKNIRIMLNNNEGAALFHFNQGVKYFPTLNQNVAAEHFATAKGWVENQGFIYLSSKNKEEFDRNLEIFLSEDVDKPIFFEVFTHKDSDARLQHEFYDKITIKDGKTAVKDGIKKLIKSALRM